MLIKVTHHMIYNDRTVTIGHVNEVKVGAHHLSKATHENRVRLALHLSFLWFFFTRQNFMFHCLFSNVISEKKELKRICFFFMRIEKDLLETSFNLKLSMLQLKASPTLPDYGVASSPSELWLINSLLSKSSFRVHSSCFLFYF